MKKSILILAVFVFVGTAIYTSCNTPEQKIENAQNDIKDANKDLDQANQEYLSDIAEYKQKTDDKIFANNKSIAEFKARKESEKNDAKDDYKIKIEALEQKNSDMKKKMDDYKADGKEQWENFKTEFSRDMDELGNAFRDLTVKNVKPINNK